jgi:hypothetical protein
LYSELVRPALTGHITLEAGSGIFLRPAAGYGARYAAVVAAG